MAINLTRWEEQIWLMGFANSSGNHFQAAGLVYKLRGRFSDPTEEDSKAILLYMVNKNRSQSEI